ncbi:MAG: GNAT family N-acetyltransferase [Polyangiaceae bacterium]
MSFQVLAADRADERASWLARWEGSEDREPFAHPAYVELFAKAEERALCAHAAHEGGEVLYPLIRRPLASLPWATGDRAADLTSPYGYGGPFASGSAVGQGDEFWRSFDNWSADEGIVTSFTRLSLFETQLPGLPAAADALFPNVVRSLELDEEGLWRDYAHKVRKNVNKAKRSGLRVEIDETGARLTDFLSIYASTMDRRDAREDYYFPETFFRTIVERMPGSYVFAHVLDGDHVVSTELVLRSRHYLYSFLGGTLAEAFDKRPNDLLKHEVTLWGMSAGLRAYVLGGGYGEADGIFRYKLSFAPQGEHPFRVLRRVHDTAGLERLLALRAADAERSGATVQPRDGFFPPYRS